MSADPTSRAAALPLREVVLESQAPAEEDFQKPTTARRVRRANVQATNYQETLPTPAPAGDMRRAPMPGHPEIEPTPMNSGPMMSEGPMTSEGAMMSEGPMVGQEQVGCETCNEGSCDGCDNGTPISLLGTAASAVLPGSDGHLGEGRLLAVVGERHPRAGPWSPRAERQSTGYLGGPGTAGAFRRRLHQQQIGERRPHPGRNVAQSLRDCRFRGRVLRPGRREDRLSTTGPTATRSCPGRTTT